VTLVLDPEIHDGPKKSPSVRIELSCTTLNSSSCVKKRLTDVTYYTAHLINT